ERALFLGQWGLKPTRGGGGPGYEELVETEGRPRLRMWLERLQTEGLLESAVVYGYFPCVSDGGSLIILDESRGERTRFTFPGQRRHRVQCESDFSRSKEAGEVAVVGCQGVAVGSRFSEATAALFATAAYRAYLGLHGLSVQLTEALAEYWHARVRAELGIGGDESLDDMLKVNIQGCRYSFGYPACPNLEDQVQLFQLLDPERIGVELSEEFQLHPEQSTSALVAHHPEAKYFNV